jgi:hypothetical protein
MRKAPVRHRIDNELITGFDTYCARVPSCFESEIELPNVKNLKLNREEI